MLGKGLKSGGPKNTGFLGSKKVGLKPEEGLQKEFMHPPRSLRANAPEKLPGPNR